MNNLLISKIKKIRLLVSIVRYVLKIIQFPRLALTIAFRKLGRCFPALILKIIPQRIQDKHRPFLKTKKTLMRALILAAKSAQYEKKTEK
jgi:hypothetical protein